MKPRIRKWTNGEWQARCGNHLGQLLRVYGPTIEIAYRKLVMARDHSVIEVVSENGFYGTMRFSEPGSVLVDEYYLLANYPRFV